MSLVEAYFKVGLRVSCAEHLGPPLQVVNAVGRDAGNRREDPTVGAVGNQVVPVRDYAVLEDRHRETSVTKGEVGGPELYIAVGAYRGVVEGTVIEVHRERQRNTHRTVVAVVAYVRSAGYYGAGEHGSVGIVGAGYGRGQRRVGRWDRGS